MRVSIKKYNPMNRLAKTFMFVLFLSAVPARIWAQDFMSNHDANTTQRVQYRDYENGILFNVFAIENVEERVQLASALATSDIWLCNPTHNPGELFIRPNSYNADIPIYAEFDYLRMTLREEYEAVSLLPKEEFGEVFNSWARNISDEYYNFLISDHLDRANHCMDAEPFCTSDVYTFPSNNSGYSWSGPDYGCLGSSPTNKHSFWYYMRIGVAGNITIKMEAPFDIDFALWGPFSNQTDPCPTAAGQTGLLTSNCTSCPNNTSNPNFYPSGNLHDCSFSAQAYEYAHVVNGQVGQYYILLITNYNGGSGNITFQKYAGDGETDCDILPPLVNNEGPYCVGETIHLSANGQAGATYSWTGPGGFTSTQQNPTRPNCTMNMAGNYTCTIAVGNQTNSATTEVVIYPQPTANFNYTSVCRGTPTQFTSTSTTNPSGQQIQSYQWNFGDGQTGSGQNVTHTYANAGNYPVTLTTSCGNGHCTSTKTQTVPVYATPTASASAMPNTVIYGGVATLSASAGTTGSFNFHWEPANKVVNPNNQTTQTVMLYETTTFTVTVTHPQGGCSSTAQVTVSMEGSNMTAMATADAYELCEGESTTLHAQPSGGTGNYTFTWTPANTLSSPTSQNPVATPPVGSTTYTCAVSDGITTQNVNVTIIVHPNEVEHEYDTICQGDNYDFHGQMVSAPDTYEYHTQTQYGCDKTVYLHLANWQTYDETTITEYICDGESYNFYGTTYNYSCQVEYTDHTHDHGCDSIVRLNLTVYPDNGYTDHPVTVCPSQLPFYYEEDPNQIPLYAGDHLFHLQDIHGCDSIVIVQLTVSDYYIPPVQTEYVCYNDEPSFYWNVNGQTYITDGLFTDTIPYADCEGIYRLDLHFQQVPETIVEPVTECDSYTWPRTGETFTESGVHHHRVSMAPFPCEQVYELDLTINRSETFTQQQDDPQYIPTFIEYTGVTGCDSVYWNPRGHSYVSDDLYQPENSWYKQSSASGSPYSRHYHNQYGCDSTVYFSVDLEYTPSPYEISPVDYNNTAPHWVITATEFQINSYDFSISEKDHPSCTWDSINWHFVKRNGGEWVDDSSIQWILEEDETTLPTPRMNCKMYVLNYIPDTIWLAATVYNKCAPQGVTKCYWFLCSFYGVEEVESSLANFDIIPNPNNGQMQLNFEYLTGKVTIKVYDMRGTLIDSFETYNNNGPNTYLYNMKDKSDGIYFFVATSKEGTVAKKVVIQK